MTDEYGRNPTKDYTILFNGEVFGWTEDAKLAAQLEADDFDVLPPIKEAGLSGYADPEIIC